MTRRKTKGTKLRLKGLDNGNGNGKFATVAYVHNLQPNEIGPEWQEATDFDSEDFVEEFVATVIRTGEIQADFYWDPKDPTHDDDTGLLAVAMAGEMRTWQLVFLADTTDEFEMEFEALVRVRLGSATPPAILGGSLTLRPSGPISIGDDG